MVWVHIARVAGLLWGGEEGFGNIFYLHCFGRFCQAIYVRT